MKKKVDPVLAQALASVDAALEQAMEMSLEEQRRQWARPVTWDDYEQFLRVMGFEPEEVQEIARRARTEG